MRTLITPSPLRSAEVIVPGDKSIAHRWLMLASVGEGVSELAGLPGALDVRSTARCLSLVVPGARSGLSAWAGSSAANPEVPGFAPDAAGGDVSTSSLRIEGEGWQGLPSTAEELDCGNSATTMRLLLGLLAAGPGER